ncbi:MAG TPA: lipid-A-disaccharide synthase [Bacteroidia bacterium]|nr:lipid-A-disaccharide synthase [Bacteroidia bacterium]
MKYYIIAGEPSGDLHASNFMKELDLLDRSSNYKFLGGDLMQKVSGNKPTIHIGQMAFMGFVDVAKNLGKIKQNFKIVKQDILDYKPDVVILVDYPGFNLRMAKWAKENGFKVFYYISPTVWAWKENRVEIIKKYVDQMFVILPFEEPFYKKRNCHAKFVGHPLLDEIEERKKTLMSREEFLAKNNISSKPLIAVLPGSRKQELERMFDIMLQFKDQFKDYELVIGGTSNIPKQLYDRAIDKGFKVVYDQTYELMSYAKAGVIKSGTSTLEAALFELPEVVCYRAGALSLWIARQVVNKELKYISLVNLIMDREIVKELIQQDMTVKNISEELKKLLDDNNYRSRIINDYKELKTKLGGVGASKRIATAMYNYFKN